MRSTKLKTCNSCGLEKSPSEFYKSANNPDGLQYICKECDRESGRIHRAKNKEHYLLYDAERRAKAKGLDFDITLEDIVIPDVCPVLGIEIRRDNSDRHPSSPSIDRVDNSKGYTKDNIRVISLRANILKNDAELWELERIVEYMRENG